MTLTSCCLFSAPDREDVRFGWWWEHRQPRNHLRPRTLQNIRRDPRKRSRQQTERQKDGHHQNRHQARGKLHQGTPSAKYHVVELFFIFLPNLICHTFSFADLQQRQRHSSRTSRKRKHVRPNHDLWTLADIVQLQRRRRKGKLDSGNANTWSTVQFVVVYLVDEIRSPSYHETPYAKAYQTQHFFLA